MHRRDHDQSDVKPLDPVALTLAVWLGLVVSVTGLMRIAQSTPGMDQPRGAAMTMPMMLAYGS